MKRFNCTLADKRGEFGECMEAHNTGRYVLFSDVEKLQRRMQEMMDKSNRTGVAIERAISTGSVLADHPLKSRLELLANHHKREQALADGMVAMADRCKLLTDLLREAHQHIGDSIPQTISEHYRGCDLLDRIDDLLAGQLPDHFPDAAKMVVTDHTEQSLAMVLEGWKLVPVEPTESMIGHGCGASVMVVSEVVMAWRAMLAAAPKHQGGEPCALESRSSSQA